MEIPLKSFLLVLYYCTVSLSQTETLFYTPALPAPGENVTLVCSFTSHPNASFLSALPTFYVDSVTVWVTAIRNNYIVNGVDLSRYSVSISHSSSFFEVSANITMQDVTMDDENTLIGCSVQKTLFTVLTMFLPVNVSEPPKRVNSLTRTPLHPLTCLTRLSWNEPYSDRDISVYTIYRDQIQIHTNPPTDLFYDVIDEHKVGETWSYSVVPTSVAGTPEGVSNVVSVHVPEFIFDQGTFYVVNGSENFLSWTTTSPFPDAVIVSYILELLEGDIVRQTFSFSSSTDDNRYSFSGSNGNNYIHHLTAYRMCSQSIDSIFIFNGEDPVTEAPVIDSTVWIISGSGVLIVGLWFIGVAVLICVCCIPRRKSYKS